MATSSSDESTTGDNWVFYKDRPEWQDVQPLAQNEGPYPVVSIAYTDKFKDVYDYFRAVLSKQEYSIRALVLCTDAIALNPANYTVWRYRRDILKHLGTDLSVELKFVEDVMLDHPKNYQVWHHRRVIVEWIGDGFDELAFTEKFLMQERKNYHAWQHRQFIVSTYNLFDNELEYIDEMLEDDVHNNSAWNHRYFVVYHTTGFSRDVIIQREIPYCLNALSLSMSNESTWNYLRGILRHLDEGLNESSVMKYCMEMYDIQTNRCTHLLSYLTDAAVEELEKLSNSDDIDACISKLNFALKLLNDLAIEYDVIRSKYWKSFAENLKVEYADYYYSNNYDHFLQENEEKENSNT